MKIKDKDIAKAIGKTQPAISYLKKTNPNEYKILKLGTCVLKMQEELKISIDIEKFLNICSTFLRKVDFDSGEEDENSKSS